MSGVLNVVFICFLLHSVQCDEFSASLPKQIEVLNGSCVTIPCTFQIENKYNINLHIGCKAIWKTDQTDQAEFKGRTTTGDLTQKNCTATLYNITSQNREYFFRLDCNNALKWNFANTKVNINVKDAPPTPILTPPTLNVSEGVSVSVQCSAPVPCLSAPPTLTWTPVLGDIQETLQEQQDKTYVKVSTLTFNASYFHHERTITCAADYSREHGTPVSAVSTPLTAQVTYGPRNTRVTVSPSGPVTEHSDVRLTCSSDANPAAKHYLWYKLNGTNHTLMGNTSVLNIKASRDTSPIFCDVQNDLGTDCSNVSQLDVLYGPRNTRVTVSPSGPVTEHSDVRLTCSSDANPSHYFWYKFNGINHTLMGNTSVLNIKASRDTTFIFCEVKNNLGTDRFNVSQLDVLYSPQILNSSHCTGDSARISCLCETEGNPFPMIHWDLQGISANLSIISKPLRSIISVNKTQWREPFTLVCHSSNSLGSDRQRFYIQTFEKEISAQSNRVELITPVLMATVVTLLVLVCVLLFVIRTLNLHLNKCQSPAVTMEPESADVLALNETQRNIYANSSEVRPEEQPNTSNPSNTDGAGEASDSVIYSNVIWKTKSKKVQDAGDAVPSRSSYLEEQRSIVGDRSRHVVSNKLVECEYAQVKFKSKKATQ